jgi:hypothetical protein
VALQFIPWDVEAQRALREHRMPWRNPFASDGAPLFANPQTALSSPFTWPRLLLGLRGWAWSIYLKLLVGSLSLFWLARELRIEARAACILAVVFIWSGYVTTLIYHPHLPGAVKPAPPREDVPDGFSFGVISTVAGVILLCAILMICGAANRPDQPIVLEHIGNRTRA